MAGVMKGDLPTEGLIKLLPIAYQNMYDTLCPDLAFSTYRIQHRSCLQYNKLQLHRRKQKGLCKLQSGDHQGYAYALSRYADMEAVGEKVIHTSQSPGESPPHAAALLRWLGHCQCRWSSHSFSHFPLQSSLARYC